MPDDRPLRSIALLARFLRAEHKAWNDTLNKAGDPGAVEDHALRRRAVVERMAAKFGITLPTTP